MSVLRNNYKSVCPECSGEVILRDVVEKCPFCKYDRMYYVDYDKWEANDYFVSLDLELDTWNMLPWIGMARTFWCFAQEYISPDVDSTLLAKDICEDMARRLYK